MKSSQSFVHFCLSDEFEIDSQKIDYALLHFILFMTHDDIFVAISISVKSN